MKYSYYAVIVSLFFASLDAYSQIVVRYNDTTRYCLTEPQALLVVEVFNMNQIHKGVIIDLEAQVTTLLSKVEILDTVSKVKTDIIEVVEAEKELSDKELKRLKRKAFWANVWNKGKEVLIAASAAGLGFGVGYLAK